MWFISALISVGIVGYSIYRYFQHHPLIIVITPSNIYEYLTIAGRDRIVRHLGLHVRHHPEHPVCEIYYYDGPNKHRIRFPKKRGPMPFTSVTNEDEKNVTADIKEVIGPTKNFHGIPTTPKLLGYKVLIFHLRNGGSQRFEENEVIHL